jgi:hypothetical protein
MSQYYKGTTRSQVTCQNVYDNWAQNRAHGYIRFSSLWWQHIIKNNQIKSYTHVRMCMATGIKTVHMGIFDLGSRLHTLALIQGSVRKDHSTFVPVFLIRANKLKIGPKLWGRTKKIGKITIGTTLKKTPWPVVRKQTIVTERLPLVGEISANFCKQRVSRGQCNKSPWPLISVF